MALDTFPEDLLSTLVPLDRVEFDEGSVSGVDVVRRPDREERLYLLRLSHHRAAAVEAALPVWKSGHRNLVHVLEVGEASRGLYVLMSGEGVIPHPSMQPNAVRTARLVLELLDGLSLAHARGLVHGHLRMSRVRVMVGVPRIFVGAPHTAHGTPDDDLEALRALAAELNPAPPAGLREALSPSLSSLEMSMALAAWIESPAAMQLLGLDDAARLLDRLASLHKIEIDEVFKFFRTRADLLRAREVGSRVLAAIGGALVDEMRAGRGSLAATSFFLERLPDLEARLVEILADADEPEAARVAAARTLGARRAGAASVALTRVLNEPLPWLREAASWALDRIPKSQAAHVDRGRLSIVPCSHRWDELMPMDQIEGRQQRFCADCEKPVQRVTDLAGLAILGQQTCGFLDPPPDEDITVDLVAGSRRLRVGQSLMVGRNTEVFLDDSPIRVRFLNAGGGKLVVSRLDGNGPREAVVDVRASDLETSLAGVTIRSRGRHHVELHGRFGLVGASDPVETMMMGDVEPDEPFDGVDSGDVGVVSEPAVGASGLYEDETEPEGEPVP